MGQFIWGLVASLLGLIRILACPSGSPRASKAFSTPSSPTVPVMSGVTSTLPSASMTTSEKIRDRLVVKHPLQPFDIRNVVPGKLIPDRPFTFDPTVLRAAKASTGERKDQPPFISGPLPQAPADDVVLEDLVAFYKDPVKGFFRALDYTLPWDVDGVEDAMCGAETPVVDGHPAGVFSWQPPASLVVVLSDLLDGRRAAA